MLGGCIGQVEQDPVLIHKAHRVAVKREGHRSTFHQRYAQLVRPHPHHGSQPNPPNLLQLRLPLCQWNAKYALPHIGSEDGHRLGRRDDAIAMNLNICHRLQNKTMVVQQYGLGGETDRHDQAKSGNDQGNDEQTDPPCTQAKSACKPRPAPTPHGHATRRAQKRRVCFPIGRFFHYGVRNVRYLHGIF